MENRCELMNVQKSAGNYGMGLNSQSAMQVGGYGDNSLAQLGAINTVYYPQPYFQNYYWGWGTTVVEKESKMDKAFKIIKKLMDIKMIKEDISVKEFMDLCEVISKEI